ncbi:MAG: pyridoxal 5'-phosphate synthase glutaminase subunit PdxT [Thermoleophilaceae bacterium]|nr:pyridoxal 5'-phosphate synthase glutaminase subunit PdxT [Thermoleophilaceae bacterium]
MAIGFRGVGVLALQGGYNAHIKKLRAMGALIREVRTPGDLANIDGLVLPGGESTTMGLGIDREGLGRPLREFITSGKPVLATCAGTILLDDAHMGLLDVSCDRNAYGASTHSFEAEFSVRGVEGGDFRGLFIRAAKISRVGPRVEVLAKVEDVPVAVRSGNVTALTFHPELTNDDRIHRAFYESIPLGHRSEEPAASPLSERPRFRALPN